MWRVGLIVLVSLALGFGAGWVCGRGSVPTPPTTTATVSAQPGIVVSPIEPAPDFGDKHPCSVAYGVGAGRCFALVNAPSGARAPKPRKGESLDEMLADLNQETQSSCVELDADLNVVPLFDLPREGMWRIRPAELDGAPGTEFVAFTTTGNRVVRALKGDGSPLWTYEGPKHRVYSLCQTGDLDGDGREEILLASLGLGWSAILLSPGGEVLWSEESAMGGRPCIVDSPFDPGTSTVAWTDGSAIVFRGASGPPRRVELPRAWPCGVIAPCALPGGGFGLIAETSQWRQALLISLKDGAADQVTPVSLPEACKSLGAVVPTPDRQRLALVSDSGELFVADPARQVYVWVDSIRYGSVTPTDITWVRDRSGHYVLLVASEMEGLRAWQVSDQDEPSPTDDAEVP